MVEDAAAQRRLTAVLAGTFAALTVALLAAGMAFLVFGDAAKAWIGIGMALGAARADVSPADTLAFPAVASRSRVWRLQPATCAHAAPPWRPYPPR